MKTRLGGLLFYAAGLLPVAARAADSPGTASAATTLPGVVIVGVQENNDVRVDNVASIGPLGSTPLMDLPYSIDVLPRNLIEDSQAVNFKDVSKYMPLVSYQEQQGPDILRPQTRGMQGGNFQNSKLDGMTMFVTVALAMEQFEQIEVVNGLSAFLYGPANPSGMFNFVSKRPTDDDLRQVNASYTSDGIGTLGADFSGKLDPEGIVRYRLNGVFAEGDGFVDHSHQRRELGDLGIDVRPWSGAVLELNYSDYGLVDTGYPGWFTYGEKVRIPSAPDPQDVGYGQAYAGTDLRTQITTARFKQDLGPDWHLVVGGLNQDSLRNIDTPVNNLTSNGGNYTSSFANGFAPRFIITSDAGYLNGNLTAFGLTHDLTLGTAGYKSQTYAVTTPAAATSVLLGKANIDDPQIFPEPPQGPPDPWANYNSSNVYQQGVNLGDAIDFNSRWSVRGGVSQDWFHTDNYDPRSLPKPGYENTHGLSPSGSLIFKPITDITTYFTYASSLQAGDTAPGTVENAGTTLAPYRSKEYEVGYKERLGKLDLTAAVYRIERPFANVDELTNTFEISGVQVNRGLELTVIGEMLPGLMMYGGMQVIDARLDHTPLDSTNDKIYVGTPKVKGNTLFEYQIAQVPGLTALINYQFSGPRPANDTNTVSAAGYDLLDLGAKYTSRFLGKPLTWRLTVNNVTDRHYWSTIGPSNLTGANTGSLLAHLGAPRMVLAGMSIGL